eukprot:15476222-Alexandrium_andersonii.AAC.1
MALQGGSASWSSCPSSIAWGSCGTPSMNSSHGAGSTADWPPPSSWSNRPTSLMLSTFGGSRPG